VIGGRHFDALIFGYWEGDRLMYAARTRSGFTPAVREQLHQRFRELEMPECPFANLPEARARRWGEGLTAAKMKTAAGSSRCWWGSLSSWSGRRISTSGIRGSSD
jgi:ATP dependent DNA ligase C terminal region